ncbi:hypothetical protein KCU65_g3746, partial [Aureobasidium melanogenum]
MYSRRTTHLWALLAIGLTIVSGLPSPQLDNDDFECESWDDEADSTQTTPSISTTATILPTPLVYQSYTTTKPSPVTFVTSVRIAQASSTSNPSPTNSFVAPINTFIPVAPPSYAFYLQSSGSGSSNGLYATVSAGAGGLATFTASKDSATKFTIDSSGDLVEQSPSEGYVATLDPNVDAQKATAIAATSNVIAQLLEQRSKQTAPGFSMPDFLRFVIFTLLTAPPNYLWQHALERIFPGRKPLNPTKTMLPRYEIREHDGLSGEDGLQQQEEPETKLDWKNTMTKWFIDCMTLGALLNTAAFIIIMGIMKGRAVHQIGTALRTDTLSIIYASYTIWPLASVINFACIPVERRIVFLSLVGLVWGVFLSLTAAKQ